MGANSEVSSTTALVQPQDTDSDPNVTSTTGIESKKKMDTINRDIKTIKKELDNLTSYKEKKDLVEESLFTPEIMQAVKPKYEKEKRSGGTLFNTIKDVKRAKESLHKDKLKSKQEKKDKMKVKQKNDLKGFLTATATITATIRKEAKREERKETEKKVDVKDEKSEHKRRLSINSEFEENEPKAKIPKLNSEVDTEIKKVKTEAMKPMGRIPKLEKRMTREKELKVQRVM